MQSDNLSIGLGGGSSLRENHFTAGKIEGCPAVITWGARGITRGSFQRWTKAVKRDFHWRSNDTWPLRGAIGCATPPIAGTSGRIELFPIRIAGSVCCSKEKIGLGSSPLE